MQDASIVAPYNGKSIATEGFVAYGKLFNNGGEVKQTKGSDDKYYPAVNFVSASKVAGSDGVDLSLIRLAAVPTTLYSATEPTPIELQVVDISIPDSLAAAFTSEVVKLEFTVTPEKDATPVNVSTNITITKPSVGSWYYLTDDVVRQTYVFDKRIVANNVDNFETYYGHAINEATLDFATSDFVKLSVTTMGTGADSNQVASSYVQVDAGEVLDTTNNIKNITLYDSNGKVVKAIFSSASLKIMNNLREQVKLGEEFATAMGTGKMSVTLTGDCYYNSQELFEKHMANQSLSAVIELRNESDEGRMIIHLPNLNLAPVTANAGGENQDFKQSITLNALEGLSCFNDNTGVLSTKNTGTQSIVKTCLIAMYRVDF